MLRQSAMAPVTSMLATIMRKYKFTIATLLILLFYLFGWVFFVSGNEWVKFENGNHTFLVHGVRPTQLGNIVYTIYLPIVVSEMYYFETMHVYDIEKQFIPSLQTNGSTTTIPGRG